MNEFPEPNWRDHLIDADGTVGPVAPAKPRVMSPDEMLHRFLALERAAQRMAGTLNVLMSAERVSRVPGNEVRGKLSEWLPVMVNAWEKWLDYSRAYEELK